MVQSGFRAPVLLLLVLLLIDTEGRFHSRSPHNAKYNLDLLAQINPRLKPFVRPSTYGSDSSHTIDFADSRGVLELNRALLRHFYEVEDWHVDERSLIPPIPSRADYVYHILDYLSQLTLSRESDIVGLDIGTGASLIYPLIATSLSFNSRKVRMVGSEVNANSYDMAQKNALQRRGAIEVRKQENPNCILTNIIQENDYFDFSMCNPPFYKSMRDYLAETNRKNRNLKISNSGFRGLSHELYCDGGEIRFINQMIDESVKFKTQVGVFTTLISSNENISAITRLLDKIDDVKYEFIDMNTGNKRTRAVAWRFV